MHSIEIYHAIKTAQLIVHAMINRKQSLEFTSNQFRRIIYASIAYGIY